MPRLFVGLEVAESWRLQLGLMRGGLENVRWIDPADFHVTLCFIGDVDRHQATALMHRLATLSAPPVLLEAGDLDTFGTKKPHALFLHVAQTAPLLALHRQVCRLADPMVMGDRRRHFVPHVTLARFRRVDPQILAHYLAHQPRPMLPGIRVNRLAVFSAKDSVGGGPYRLEARFPLDQPD